MAKNKNKGNPPQSRPFPLLPQPQVSTVANQTANQLIFNATAAQLQYQGPIPPPDVLKQYDSVMPGLAARIIAMAEQEATHRRTIEAQIVAAQANDLVKFRRTELTGKSAVY